MKKNLYAVILMGLIQLGVAPSAYSQIVWDSLGAVPIATTSSMFNMYTRGLTRLATVPQLGIVTLIHNQNVDNWGGGIVETRIPRLTFSINGGNTWYSETGDLNFNRWLSMPTFNILAPNHHQLLPSLMTAPMADSVHFVYAGGRQTGCMPMVGDFHRLMSLVPNTDTVFGTCEFHGVLNDMPLSLTDGLPGEAWMLTVNTQDALSYPVVVHRATFDAQAHKYIWAPQTGLNYAPWVALFLSIQCCCV